MEDGCSQEAIHDTSTADVAEHQEDEESVSNDQSSSEDGEDEDEDEDTEPPRLKYTRFTKLPASFYSTDAISTCLADKSVVVFGTHSGVVHVMTPDLQPVRTFRAHRASVLSIDTDGQYIATGSMDGTVVVGSIDDPGDIVAYDFKRPIHAVVFDGAYASTKSFITGGTSGKVIHSSKNWLGQRVDTVLSDSEGIILALKRYGDLLVWLSDNGINFYQLSSRAKLHKLGLPAGFPRPDLYWPKCEVNNNSLLVGWADNLWEIKLVDVANDSRSILSSRSVSSEKKIHVEKHAQLKGTLIAGISSINDDYLLLNFPSAAGSSKRVPPELKIVSGLTLEDLSVEEVELKNYASLGLNDYHLHRYQDSRWFLVGANDVVIVDEFNASDRLKWFLDRHEYTEAWAASAGLMPVQTRYSEIAYHHLNALTENSQWQEAKDFLLEVTSSFQDPELLQKVWEEWLDKFAVASQFDSIVDHIPSVLQLNPAVYNAFVVHYLDAKDEKFLQLLEIWDHSWLDISAVNVRLGELLTDYDQGDKDHLSEALVLKMRKAHVELCLELNDFAHAASHLFVMQDESTLQFLSKYHLLSSFFSRIPEALLLGFSRDELAFTPVGKLEGALKDRVGILVQNRHEIVPDDVLKLFKTHELDVINFLYLKQLFVTPGFIGAKYEDDLIELASSFDPGLLLSYLQSYRNYTLERAIKISEEKQLTEELVFLYSKIGENKKALDLIINDLKDPAYAISFTLSLKDSELFEHLIDYSAEKPEFVKALIVEAGNNNVDPEKIITRIPTGISVEHLQDTLVNITNNNSTETFIHSKILRILQDEVMALIYELRDGKAAGVAFDPKRQKKLLQEETVITFTDQPERLYKESELLGESGVWNKVARNIPEKIKHFLFLKGKRIQAS